jgi:(3,5-dihydroxyphenyl)acetyl-CoA 1,2-dioxygenase
MSTQGVSTVESELLAAGLATDDVQRWIAACPVFPGDGTTPLTILAVDREAASHYWALGDDLLRRLPGKSRRTPQEAAAADAIKEASREIRVRFMRAWASRIYLDLTGHFGEYVRVDDLAYRAAERFPGLVPTRAAVEAERQHLQRDKDGVEIDQGIFLSYVLAHHHTGKHLCWAMLRPRPDSLERLEELERTGFVDLGAASVRRVGRAGHVLMRNTRYLNAEDDSTLDGLEMAVDLVTLDPEIDVAVLRGAKVEHPRYRDRHVFSAGINLTHLYQGQISYLFYMVRDLGLVNKMYRGLTGPEFLPDEPETTLEKPWVAAVEAFAIGGGCQILLVMDHVLAEQGAFFNLPARKEGIIPGVANLRLPRFVGDRLARQGILFERQFPAESPEGRLICDRVVPVGGMDAAIDEAVAMLTGSGVVSAAGNRKALRIGQEPLDLFRTYMATYAREQAYCHFSPALIENLERHWNARQRKP